MAKALLTISGTFWPFLPLKFIAVCLHSNLEDTFGELGTEGLSDIEIKLFIKDGGWIESKVEHMELVKLDSSVSLSIDWFCFVIGITEKIKWQNFNLWKIESSKSKIWLFGKNYFDLAYYNTVWRF